MRSHIRNALNRTNAQLKVFCCVAAMLGSTSLMAANTDKVYAFIADEHNTTPTTPSGNRTISIDIENMRIVQEIEVPGLLNHHADNSFNSKIYSVPKGSNFFNVVNLTKDESDVPTMELTTQVDLIHSPRSSDAYNQKYGALLLTAKNRPMASFIDVETNQVLGTIGENVDCILTTGEELLDQANPNSHENATKYQCKHTDYGGNQISGHPYWLTTDYAAIVDRTNRQISVYKVWEENDKLRGKLVNHLPTRTSIHQIIPRDRSQLPKSEQADFYAIEEGSPSQGIPPAVLKLKLTTKGLILEKRVNLGRTQKLWGWENDPAENLTQYCSNIESEGRDDATRYYDYEYLLLWYGLEYSPDEAWNIEKPIACMDPRTQGAHNADFAPDNEHLYVGSKEGSMFIVNVDRMKVIHNIDTGSGYGKGSGSGHTTFAKDKNIAIVTNHTAPYLTAINTKTQKKIKDIPLPFSRENIFNSVVSHTSYIDDKEQYYYNSWTDGGIFFRVNLDTLDVDGSVYTGGIPIHASYISTNRIDFKATQTPLTVQNDNARSDGEKVIIDVLANDSGDDLVIEDVSKAENGQVTIVDGKVEYTPNARFSGTEKLWYYVDDSYGTTKRGLITITVEATNPVTPIEAYSDSATTTGETVSIDVLANDKGMGLDFGTIYNGYYGTVKNNSGILEYTPVADFSGEDFFWYEIIDSNDQHAWGRVTITVTQGNFSVSDEKIDSDGSAITIDVLANDTGEELRFGTIYNGYHGSSQESQGKIIYTPITGYTGTDFFYYEVIDEQGHAAWGKVDININPAD
jgi:hypothetical protein